MSFKSRFLLKREAKSKMVHFIIIETKFIYLTLLLMCVYDAMEMRQLILTNGNGSKH